MARARGLRLASSDEVGPICDPTQCQGIGPHAGVHQPCRSRAHHPKRGPNCLPSSEDRYGLRIRIAAAMTSKGSPWHVPPDGTGLFGQAFPGTHSSMSAGTTFVPTKPIPAANPSRRPRRR